MCPEDLRVVVLLEHARRLVQEAVCHGEGLVGPCEVAGLVAHSLIIVICLIVQHGGKIAAVERYAVVPLGKHVTQSPAALVSGHLRKRPLVVLVSCDVVG